MFSPVTADSFEVKHIKEFNKSLNHQHLKKTSQQGLFMKKLDQESVHLRVYSDAFFANNYDPTS